MNPMLAYFVNKLKEGYWLEGTSWEFDWYLDCFFVEAMAYGTNPMYLGYEQPVLGDQFLTVRIQKKIIRDVKQRLTDNVELQHLIAKQASIIAQSSRLIHNVEKNHRIDFTHYEQIQKDLSLLMATVSVAVDEFVSEQIIRVSSEEQIDEQLLIAYILEQSNISALSESNKNLISIHGLSKLKLHAQKYGWLNTGERGGQAWVASDFAAQQEKLINKKRGETIALPLRISKNNRVTIDSLIHINGNDNLAADRQVKLDFLFQRFLKEKLGSYYQEEIIENLTYSEILSLIKRPSSISGFQDRKNNYLRLAYPAQGKLHTYYFSNSQEFDAVVRLVQNIKIKEKVTGSVACRGRAEGIVKIIHSKQDLMKLQQGDILIASKTQPSYVTVMTTAAAIVTDIGGITSHAAIIAREFNIPSVVGTGNATKIFTDGDRVFVDAEKGVVSKII